MTIVEKMQEKRNEIKKVSDEKVKEAVSKIGEEFEKEQDENLEKKYFSRRVLWNGDHLILTDNDYKVTVNLIEEVKYKTSKETFYEKLKEMLSKEGIRVNLSNTEDMYMILVIELK